MPILGAGVVMKISPDLAPAIQAGLVDKLQPHLIGEHVPHGVEITRIETVDVPGEQRTLRLGQHRNGEILGLPGDLPQTLAAPIERRLDGRDGGPGHLADFIQGMAEHIHQDDATALRRRQPHEGPQARRRGLTLGDRIDQSRGHLRPLAGMDGFVAPPAAQKIQRRVVRDAEQPALEIGDPSGRRKALIAFISASWTMSSPSITEPVMRAQ